MNEDIVNIHFNSQLEGRLKTSCLIFDNINNSSFNAELWKAIDTLAVSIREKYQSPSDALFLFQPSRDLYKKIGLDPTRRRPSSEALRRIIQHKPLFKVNTLVDACNFCSSTFALSIGLYDIDKIEGDVTLRLGSAGEHYEGINKGLINVTNKFILADEKSPFGNPSSDSDRTKITLTTNRTLFVIFAPPQFENKKLQDFSNYAHHTLQTYCEANLVNHNIFPN
jgi:DNA/RNA-binding domain of Phe-tRNA-synthetase-like protein